MFSLQKTDEIILNAIDKHCRNSLLDRVMPIITKLGDMGAIWIVISLRLLISKQYIKDGYIIILTLVLSTVISEGLIKNLVRRPRPCTKIPASDLLISKPLSYSFPSGHTTSSFAVAGVFTAMIRPYMPYVIVMALLIAFSRLYLLVHYPSDVLIGIVLGLLCSMIVLSSHITLSSISNSASFNHHLINAATIIRNHLLNKTA